MERYTPMNFIEEKGLLDEYIELQNKRRKEYLRIRAKENPLKKEYSKRYRDKNKEKISEYQKKYRTTNNYKEYQRNYNKKKREVMSEIKKLSK